jgi:hypothetical protein
MNTDPKKIEPPRAVEQTSSEPAPKKKPGRKKKIVDHKIKIRIEPITLVFD